MEFMWDWKSTKKQNNTSNTYQLCLQTVIQTVIAFLRLMSVSVCKYIHIKFLNTTLFQNNNTQQTAYRIIRKNFIDILMMPEPTAVFRIS